MNPEIEIEIVTPENLAAASLTPEQLVDFLHAHLDQFRDPKSEIMQCLDYALGKRECRRGFILLAKEKEKSGDSGKVLGATVVCETGMSGFVPENLLVYIAVDRKARGRGIGRILVEKVIDTARGDIALHVEPDNPACRLYEHVGFTSKYIEMRFKK